MSEWKKLKIARARANVHFEQDTGEVIEAACTCVAGNAGCCKPVAAASLQMLDIIELELTEVLSVLTCTQLLQEQHVSGYESIKKAILFDSVKATSTIG